MSHNHSHSHPTLSGKNLLISIVLNVVITAAQVIGGIVSGSLALISDAVHNFSDVISLIISYVANLLTHKKKQTKEVTFGYKRAEIIAAFINGASLIIIALYLAFEAFKKLSSEVTVIKSELVIWLAILGIAVNGFSVLLLKNDAENNLNMKAAYLHLLTDMLTSIAVLIGGLLMKYFHIYWIDAVLTLIISLYLIYMSWGIFISSLKILMLFAPKHIIIDDVATEVLTINEIKNIHHVHIWQLNDHDCHIEAHIEFKEDINLSKFDEICEQIEIKLLKKFHITHCNFQPEFKRNDSKDLINVN